MTVYVDDVRIRYGRMLMCHLWADSRDELFAMVDTIGVQRKWFQRPPSVGLPGMTASWEHFDISLAKKARAIEAGAVLTDMFGPAEHVARLIGNIARLERIAFSRIQRALPPDGRL